MNKNDHSLLEAFVIDNSDLNLLESKLSNFNVFEAVGMTRQEIRHSYFLAFLLNPSESHYFGDLFLKKFLISALRSLESPPLSAITIDVADLEDSEVRREYKNIDILIYSQNEKIVVAIENKVDSGEHDDQLNRYKDIVLTEFSGYQVFLIYLTKKGDQPSTPHWHPLSYEIISQCIDEICIQHAAKMNTDVHTLMTHYSNLIKRHIWCGDFKNRDRSGGDFKNRDRGGGLMRSLCIDELEQAFNFGKEGGDLLHAQHQIVLKVWRLALAHAPLVAEILGLEATEDGKPMAFVNILLRKWLGYDVAPEYFYEEGTEPEYSGKGRPPKGKRIRGYRIIPGAYREEMIAGYVNDSQAFEPQEDIEDAIEYGYECEEIYEYYEDEETEPIKIE